MIKPNQSDTAAAVERELAKAREAATQPPAPFRDERPAPSSEGAATKRNAAKRNAGNGGSA